MTLTLRSLFHVSFPVSSTLSRSERLAQTQAFAWENKHEIKYLTPLLERALGKADVNGLYRYIDEAEELGLSGLDLDLYHLRALYLSSDKEGTVNAAEEFINKHPEAVVGWIYWIQIHQIMGMFNKDDKVQTYLSSKITTSAQLDTPTKEALLILANTDVFTLKERDMCLMQVANHPNHAITQFNFLTYPQTEDFPVWNVILDKFLAAKNGYPPELMPNVLIGLFRNKDYKRLISIIDTLTQNATDHYSLNFLKTLSLLESNPNEALNHINDMRQRSSSSVVDEPLFIGSEKARAIVGLHLNKLGHLPINLRLHLGEYLAYINEAEWALRVLKPCSNQLPQDAWLLAKCSTLETYRFGDKKQFVPNIKDHFNKAIHLSESNPALQAKIYELYGHALSQMNLFEEALQAFEKAPEDKKFGPLAELHITLDRYDMAKTTLVEAGKRYKLSAHQYKLLGDCFHREKEIDRALFNYSQAIELDERLERAWAMKSICHLEKQEDSESRLSAQKAYDLGAKEPGVISVLAHTNFVLQDFKAAFDWYLEFSKIADMNLVKKQVFFKAGVLIGRTEEPLKLLESENFEALDPGLQEEIKQAKALLKAS